MLRTPSLRILPTILLICLAMPATAQAGLNRAELIALGQVNTYRATRGLPRLVVQPALVRAAEWMSTDMARNNYFSHTDRFGRDSLTRIHALGYPRVFAGENLAVGFAQPARALRQWRSSPSHASNLRRRSFRAVGIARVYDPRSSYGWYWSLTFGTAR